MSALEDAAVRTVIQEAGAEILRLRAREAAMGSLIEECEDWLADRADAETVEGVWVGNAEMVMLVRIREARRAMR